MSSAFGEAGKRKELGRALTRLRVASGLTQTRLAAKLKESRPDTKLSQPKISRVETGVSGIKVPEVDDWCRETGADEETRRELLALAEEIRLGPQSWEEAGDDSELVRSTAEIEAKAGLISVYQPAIIPGLLQTASYATRVLSAGPDGEPPNIAQKVYDRLQRQRVIRDGRKRFRFVIPEAVLRWPFDDVDEQIEQLERLLEVVGRPNVDLRIAPLAGTRVWRTGGFVLFDELDGLQPLVHLELLTRPLTIEEQDQVDFYRQVFEGLFHASLPNKQAEHLIQRVINDFREAGT